MIRMCIATVTVTLIVGCSNHSRSDAIGFTDESLRPDCGFAIFTLAPNANKSTVSRVDSMLGHDLHLNAPPLVDSSHVQSVRLHTAPGQFPFVVLELTTDASGKLLDSGITVGTSLAAEIDHQLVSGGCVKYDGNNKLTISSGIGGPDVTSILQQ